MKERYGASEVQPEDGSDIVRSKTSLDGVGVADDAEIERFLGLVERLPELDADEVRRLNVVARAGLLEALPTPKGLF